MNLNNDKDCKLNRCNIQSKAVKSLSVEDYDKIAEWVRIASCNNIIIRKSTYTDIPRMREIFARARQFMVETGNPNQWVGDYPDEEFLRDDIESGDSYVCLSGRKIVATFLLRGGIDTTYNTIFEGNWLNEEPYATIHRIASDGSVKGIMHTAMTFALLQYDNIRIDTHRDNMVMQNAIEKEGFKYCGIIHCWNGDERLAYQYLRKYDKRQMKF